MKLKKIACNNLRALQYFAWFLGAKPCHIKGEELARNLHISMVA